MQRYKIGLITVSSLTFILFMTAIRLLLWLQLPHEAAIGVITGIKVLATGFVFDLATLSYALIPVALYLLLVPRRLITAPFHSRIILIAYFLYIAALYFDLCAEYLFFDEFATRFNFIAVDYLIYTREVVGNIRESYPLTAILSCIAFAALLTTWLLRRPLHHATEATFSSRFRRTGALFLLPALVALAACNVSQTAISTSNYANELAGNGIYNLVAAFRNNELDFKRFYLTADGAHVMTHLRSLLAPDSGFSDHGIRHVVKANQPTRKLNLVVIIEESLSAEYLGSFGNKEQITPNLDRLATQSLLFTSLYATGTRTVRGLEALALSIPPLPGSSIVKRPGNNGFNSWGEILKTHGYDTKYIYAGHGYFDNMNAFFSGNGYTIVDRSNFAKDEISFSNIWGVCDEDLFRKVIREANGSYANGKPFFSMVMTTSNHRPFTYPDNRIDIPSKSGRKGGVKYADYAIGRLIAESRNEPWFKDTIFVIVADHCAGSAGKTDIPADKYRIPLLVYSPAHIKPSINDHLISQIDIAPTILGLMQVNYTSSFIGYDVLKHPERPGRAFISTYQKLGYLTDDKLLVMGPNKYAAQYQVDRRTGAATAEKLNQPLLDEMLAYYQGANYIYKNRLNRIRQTND